jgi:hypothetical protein
MHRGTANTVLLWCSGSGDKQNIMMYGCTRERETGEGEFTLSVAVPSSLAGSVSGMELDKPKKGLQLRNTSM